MRMSQETAPRPSRRTERVEVAAGVELAIDRWTVSADASPAAGASPFLLVHGLASNARLWDGVAARLAEQGYPAVTVDLRGHGRSSKPDQGYDVPTVAADLAVLIERAGLGRPVVAGQSWGGNVVLELAAAHPQAVAAVACVDGGWLDPHATFADWEACLAALAPPRLAGRPYAEIAGHIRAAHPDWPEAGLAGTLANFERRPDGTVAPWLTYDRHIDVLRGMWAYRPASRYGAVTVPVLLLAVEPREAAPPDVAGRKRQAVGAALAALPVAAARWARGDHDIHAQRPAEVADLLVALAHGALTP